VIKAVKKGEWVRNGDIVTAGSVDLHPGEYQLKLVPKASGASAALGSSSGVVVLDIELTPELEAEGVARDVIRLVQQHRRDAALDVSDRIQLRLSLPEKLCAQVSAHHETIEAETLAVDFEVTILTAKQSPNADLDGVAVFVALNPIS
jgi:isoleucyl-tRNA synthetase